MLSLSKHGGQRPLPATLRQAQGDGPLFRMCGHHYKSKSSPLERIITRGLRRLGEASKLFLHPHVKTNYIIL